jgi:hypothetical protein
MQITAIAGKHHRQGFRRITRRDGRSLDTKGVEFPRHLMSTQILSSSSLEQVITRILASRRITHADQHQLLLPRTLTPQEQALINRLFDQLRNGLIKVVD